MSGGKYRIIEAICIRVVATPTTNTAGRVPFCFSSKPISVHELNYSPLVSISEF